MLIHANDSDAVARHLLTTTSAKDLEITARGLEDAFIALTSDTQTATSPVVADAQVEIGGSR